MADAAKVRKWAKENGHGAARGVLKRALIDEWDTSHPDDPYTASPPRGAMNGDGGTATPDYPDDDFEAMFPDPAASGAESHGDGPGDTGETPPSKPRPRQRAKGSAGSKWPFGKRPAPKAKRKPPRVSTEDLLGSLWRAGAKLATPLPPLQRTLRLQAPVAGLLLEDAVKETMLDPFLQPLARLANSGKTIQALAGPPAFVTAIMLHQMQRAQAGEDPQPLFMSIATEGLRSSLMAWMDVAGPKFEVAMQREAEFEAKYGQTVDETIVLIFAMPVDPADAEAVQAEDDAIRRAQGIL